MVTKTGRFSRHWKLSEQHIGFFLHVVILGTWMVPLAGLLCWSKCTISVIRAVRYWNIFQCRKSWTWTTRHLANSWEFRLVVSMSALQAQGRGFDPSLWLGMLQWWCEWNKPALLRLEILVHLQLVNKGQWEWWKISLSGWLRDEVLTYWGR